MFGVFINNFFVVIIESNFNENYKSKIEQKGKFVSDNLLNLPSTLWEKTCLQSLHTLWKNFQRKFMLFLSESSFFIECQYLFYKTCVHACRNGLFFEQRQLEVKRQDNCSAPENLPIY